MTVAQLMSILESQPPDALVLVESEAAEQGFNHLTVHNREVHPIRPEGYWDGEFETSRDGEPRLPAVTLERVHERLGNPR